MKLGPATVLEQCRRQLGPLALIYSSVEDPHIDLAKALGVRGFDRLHEWLWDPAGGEFVRRRSGPAGELWDEMDATVAVLAGRRTVEQVDHWGGGCSRSCRRASSSRSFG